MSIKLGSTDINKLYLGSTQINKAYLGTDIVFSGVTEYFLALDGTNQDHLLNPTYSKVIDSTVTDYLLCFEIDVPLVNPIALEHIFDFGETTFNSGSIRGQIASNGGLTLFVKGATLSFANFIMDFAGQKVVIDFKLLTTGAELVINGVIKASDNALFTSMNIVSKPFYIGSKASGSGYLSANIHNFTVDGELFECNEGIGFPVTGDNLTVFTGTTSEGTGIIYWDGSVWTEA